MPCGIWFFRAKIALRIPCSRRSYSIRLIRLLFSLTSGTTPNAKSIARSATMAMDWRIVNRKRLTRMP